jgi:formiminoglutamate deiminase
VHNQRGGGKYDNPAELSECIVKAADLTGIGLTHLPVLYTYGGADKRALEGGQLRFHNTADSFAELISRCRAALARLPGDCTLGIAPHSLRATSPDELKAALTAHPDGPVHIHTAEQLKEVEEIKHHYGSRPVDWLLDNAQVDERWCLIHATHMTARETKSMAASGGVAGLCPITESNLGDGIFNGAGFLDAGGVFGIGSDSNINISMTEELRTLEYSQRLRDRSRNVLVKCATGSTGATLYLGAAQGGARAMGRDCGRIETGALADLIAIDSQNPALCALRDDQLLDGLVFVAKDNVVTDLWSAGRHQIRAGQHINQDEINTRYRATMADLKTQVG